MERKDIIYDKVEVSENIKNNLNLKNKDNYIKSNISKELNDVFDTIENRDLEHTQYNICGVKFDLFLDPKASEFQNKNINQYVHKLNKFSEEYTIYYVEDNKILKQMESILKKNIKLKNFPKKIATFRDRGYHYENEIGNTKVYKPSSGNHMVSRKDNNIYLVVNPDSKNKDDELLRIMREVILRTQENHGKTIFHAACVSVNNRGIMLCGNAGSGKNTLMTHIVDGLGGHYIANDRVLIGKDDNKFSLNSFPTPIRVGVETIKAFPKYIDYFSKNKSSRAQECEIKSKNLYSINDNAKVEITPFEFVKAFGVDMKDNVQLGLIIQPQILKDSSEIHIELLKPEKIVDLLTLNCYTPNDVTWKNPWIVPRNKENYILKAKSEKMIEQLAQNIKAIKVCYGVNASKGNIDKSLSRYINS